MHWLAPCPACSARCSDLVMQLAVQSSLGQLSALLDIIGMCSSLLALTCMLQMRQRLGTERELQ